MIGTTYYFSAMSTSDKGIVTPASFDGDAIYFTAKLADALTSGNEYSFTVRMENQDGELVNNSGWGGSSVYAPGVGTLELSSDGTFIMEITGDGRANLILFI